MTHKTGLEDYYIIRNNKKMRFGYTTGTCAAAASKAAAQMLLSGEEIREIPFLTPKGILLNLEVGQIEKGEDHVSCAVRKDAGDDPDMTDGLEIYSRVRKTGEARIVLDGGPGVGRVTKKGLEQPVGNAAINKVPRSMILKAVEDVSSEYDYEGGLEIIISVPGGEEAAKKTFNPRLGIQGGISILGTSGIVEPMSESALIKTIEVEMRQRVENGSRFLLVTPGNYGSAYLKEHMDLPLEEAMKCSNYVGETIDMAVSMGVEGILFVSHIGKFVKVAAGIMNTHSRCADARAEVLASNAIRAGISAPAALEILNTVTTDEALVLIEREGKLQETIKEITDRISYYLHHRAYDRMMLGAVIFSNEFGYLGETEKAGELMELLREQDVTDQ
ncbi:cobalt-precorrin-5B (C(1))-methyltransferase CbiD [Blautia pseudococcoides]|uniref:cobalt-precorrin-5B (C(1))-methyltransferase CbiD n=1 Tax=Blautia pseudococcoides TaxID=1796616 RepID=UPI00148B30DA|nr:cobalt-precorrin-5B (C(1))-methyltransferase CbiD [Blautia pseudococcoides]QJU14579.1 cobalamin biosynthesis protein CbiD [Blautia pseudococcoides]